MAVEIQCLRGEGLGARLYVLIARLYVLIGPVCGGVLVAWGMQVYKKRLDNTRGDNWLQQPRRRFHVVLQQRAVKLLGRSVDLNYILADHLNRRLASDLETALKVRPDTIASHLLPITRLQA